MEIFLFLMVSFGLGMAVTSSQQENPPDPAALYDSDASFIIRHQNNKRCYQDRAVVLDKQVVFKRCFVAKEIE